MLRRGKSARAGIRPARTREARQVARWKSTSLAMVAGVAHLSLLVPPLRVVARGLVRTRREEPTVAPAVSRRACAQGIRQGDQQRGVQKSPQRPSAAKHSSFGYGTASERTTRTWTRRMRPRRPMRITPSSTRTRALKPSRWDRHQGRGVSLRCLDKQSTWETTWRGQRAKGTATSEAAQRLTWL